MNNLLIEIKPFKALSLEELYQVLALRNLVFIVEQKCLYEDIDAMDTRADHIMIWDGDVLVSYARVFTQGIIYQDAACIGRVIVKKEFRKFGLGNQIIKQAIAYINQEYQTNSIEIGAQEYLKEFYESHGFRVTSESYLDVGIPHIQMRIN